MNRIRRGGGDVAMRLARARVLHQAGRLTEAEQVYRGILIEQPAHVEAMQLLGVLGAQRGEHAAALLLLERAAQLSPERDDIRNNLGVVYKSCGRLSDAESCFSACLEESPGDADLWNNVGTVLHGLGRLEEAERHLRRSLELRPDFAVAKKNLAAVLQDGERFDEAATVYAALDADGVSDPEIPYNQALMAMRQGRMKDAEAAVRKALALRAEYPEAEVILAVIIEGLGRAPEAQVLYRRLADAAPEDVAVQFRLGQAFRAVGRWPDAVHAFQRVLAVNGSWIDALVPAAEALNAIHCYKLAERCARRALEGDAAHSGAREQLAIALMHQGRYGEARKALVPLLAGDGREAKALRIAALVELEAGCPTTAETYIKERLDSAPNDFAAWHLYGRIDSERGNFTTAVDHYRHAWQRMPALVEAGYSIGQVKRFDSPDDADFQRLLAWDARRDVLRPGQQVQLDFALGKAWAELQDYERAFTHYARGNKNQKSLVFYDEAVQERWADKILETFSPSLFERLQSAGCMDETPVFIVGMPRSGTTLIEQVLAAHPQVRAGGELRTVNRLIAETWPADQDGGFPYVLARGSVDGLKHFSEGYLDRVRELAHGRARVTDKMPGNFLYAGLLRLVFPRARIIYACRGAMDNCLSCYTTLFSSGHEYSYDLQQLGRMYRLHERVMDHWRVIPGMNLLEVSYENLVGDFENEARRLVDYLGLPWSDRCLQFHALERVVSTASLAQVRRPIYTSSVGKWHRYATQLAPLAEALGMSEAEASAPDGPGGEGATR